MVHGRRRRRRRPRVFARRATSGVTVEKACGLVVEV